MSTLQTDSSPLATERIGIFYINLDRASERLEHIQQQLTGISIVATRVPAIDGQTLGEPPWEGVSHKQYERCHGKTLSPNEAACFLSHIKAQQMFLDSDKEFAIILEDDVAFAEGFTEAVQQLLACSKRWDVVKLESAHSGTPITKCRLGDDTHRLVTYMTRTTHAGAYLLNRKAAEIYTEKLLPMHVPYDHSFDRAWKLGIKFRGVYPLIAWQNRKLDSDIHYNLISKMRKPWHQRGPMLFYRTMNEINRVLYGIRHSLFSA